MKRIATQQQAGLRLDVWLHNELPQYSRTRIQALIADGQITVAGQAIKPNTIVTEGMTATIRIPPVVDVGLVPEPIPLQILHEDEELIVINKQADLVVHPAAGHPAGTLVNALLFHCRELPGIGGERRPGIVHRLDKDTTGVLVAAKTDRCLQDLVRQFKSGDVRKEYLAIVQGVPDPSTGTIDTVIGRSSHDRKKMSARPRVGRRAITHYRVRATDGALSVVEVRIETGRTHQIRVHLSHIGHPILGDKQYAAPRKRRSAAVRAPRQMLHALRLSFVHPATQRRVAFHAPPPEDMQALLARLAGEPA